MGQWVDRQSGAVGPAWEALWPSGPVPADGVGVPRRVMAFLRQCVEDRTFPGAVAGVWEDGRWRWRAWVGWACLGPNPIPVTWATVFDLASLTKPLGTAARAVWGHLRGAWDLTRPLAEALPVFAEAIPPRRRLRGTDVLNHRAGFPAWAPLYALSRNRRARWRLLCRWPWTASAEPVYSCLGYQWLGLGWSQAGIDLAGWVRQMTRRWPPEVVLQFRPDRRKRRLIAATEWKRRHEWQLLRDFWKDVASLRAWVRRPLQWREDPRWFPDRFLWGEVHDLNAWTLGGVAGNAGLFGNAEGVARAARWWLAWRRVLAPLESDASSGPWCWGWQLGWPGQLGRPASAWSHTGFTGTMVAIDWRRFRIYVLLTHRVHPEVRPIGMNDVRRRWLYLCEAPAVESGSTGQTSASSLPMKG